MRLLFIFLSIPLLAGAAEPGSPPPAALPGAKVSATAPDAAGPAPAAASPAPAALATSTKVPATTSTAAPSDGTPLPAVPKTPEAAADPSAAAPPAPIAIVAASAEPAKDSGAGEEHWYSLSEGKHFGLGIDAGFPDGGGVTALFRPWWWLRFNGGLAYNYLGFGYRGGVSLQPVHWGATPTLSLDIGHYASGDATKFASTSNVYEQNILKNATYSFASAQIGLEFGSQQSFAFYLRGGLVHIFDVQAKGADVTGYVNSNASDKSTTYTMGDVRFTATIPCFSLGFIIFIY